HGSLPMRCAVTLLTVVLLCSAVARAQDVQSGPDKGKAVPELKVHAVTGPVEGKELDYAAERKKKPTVYLFVNAEKWDRPMGRFVRALDDAVQKMDGAAVVAVWVGGDADKNKEYLPNAQKSLNLKATALTAFTGDKEGPKGWNVNADAH